jgi:alpha-galactosidase
MFNPPWGGGLEGIMWALDTTRPEVLTHLEDTARHLTDVGYTYLKLDFTFAPSFDGVFADPAATPAERVRAGFDAVRRGAGADTFILGCGAPIGHVIGAVDGMRIGADVAPSWDLDPARAGEPEPQALPATAHAVRNTLARSFMHRALWLNDPDCVMLRTTDTDLTAEQVRTWAQVVGVSGGMVLVSDALANLGDGARALLAEVITLGQEVDGEARSGDAPVCVDLLEAGAGGPTTLATAGHQLRVDTVSGAAELTARR